MHVDEITSEKRTAQNLQDNLLSIKRLVLTTMDLNGVLTNKFQHLDGDIEGLIRYYLELATVMDNLSVEGCIVSRKIEQLILENRFDVDTVFKIIGE